MTALSYSALSHTATKPVKNEFSSLPTGENVEVLDTAEAEAELGDIAGRIRTLAHDLHPPALQHLALGDALDKPPAL